MLVTITARDHRLRLIHTHGNGENEELTHWDGRRVQEAEGCPGEVLPVGVTLRHTWANSYELPFDNLDEFNRKLARNDHWLPALWEMGIQHLRLPVGDLYREDRRRRISALIKKGFRFTFFSAGVPARQARETVRQHHRLMEAWEIIAPQYRLTEVVEDIKSLKADIPVRTYLSKLAHTSQEDFDHGTHFHHFADHGFAFEDLAFVQAQLERHPGGGVFDGIVFSTRRYAQLPENMRKAAGVLRGHGAAVILQALFPRVDEGVISDCDLDVANLAAVSLTTAQAVAGTVVFFDTFVDHDRGYFPRHGLLDRRYNPRMGLHVLSHLGDVLQDMDPIDDAKTIASPHGIGAVAVRAGARSCILVMPDASEGLLEFNASEITAGDGSPIHWLDLVSGRKVKVELRHTSTNPVHVSINPTPNPGAPGVLLMG